MVVVVVVVVVDDDDDDNGDDIYPWEPLAHRRQAGSRKQEAGTRRAVNGSGDDGLGSQSRRACVRVRVRVCCVRVCWQRRRRRGVGVGDGDGESSGWMAASNSC